MLKASDILNWSDKSLKVFCDTTNTDISVIETICKLGRVKGVNDFFKEFESGSNLPYLIANIGKTFKWRGVIYPTDQYKNNIYSKIAEEINSHRIERLFREDYV